MLETESMVAQATLWILKQVGGGAASSGGGLVLGQVLQAVGAAGPSLQDLKDEVSKIQTALGEVDQRLTSVSTRLDTLLTMAELSRTELLSRLEQLKIWEPIQKIDAAYNNLLEFDSSLAGTPHANRWASELVEAIGKGKYDIDLQLRIMHNGIIDGALGGFLSGYTDHVLAKLKHHKLSLLEAYEAVEYQYGELLSAQLHGLLLYTEALRYRDRLEQAETTPGATAAPAAAFHSAEDYLSKVFNRHIEDQIALYLHCVDRLVLSQADLRVLLPTMPAFLAPDSLEVYRRADLFARCACPGVHGHEVVTRLIGDATWIEALVDHWQHPAVPGAFRTEGVAELQPQLVMLAGKAVSHVLQDSLTLPADEFPTGEFLEFTVSGCRPQTRVAIAKFGRSSRQPRSLVTDQDGLPASPETLTVMSTEFQWYDGALKASWNERHGSFLLCSSLAVRRAVPSITPGYFGPEDIHVFGPVAAKPGEDLPFLSIGLRPEMKGRTLGVQFGIAQKLNYDWDNYWYATKASNYVFKYAIADGEPPSWLQAEHAVGVRAWDTDMRKTVGARQSTFVPAVIDVEGPRTSGRPAQIRLKYRDTLADCQWAQVHKRRMAPPDPCHPVLDHFSFHLTDLKFSIIAVAA